jgi:hypothetical protein
MTFVDTLGTAEYFVEALARVDRIGPNRRLVFTTTQPDGSGGMESVAVVKLVMCGKPRPRWLPRCWATVVIPRCSSLQCPCLSRIDPLDRIEARRSRRRALNFFAVHQCSSPYHRLIWSKASMLNRFVHSRGMDLMTTLQAIGFGAMLAWTPSVVLMVWMLWETPLDVLD